MRIHRKMQRKALRCAAALLAAFALTGATWMPIYGATDSHGNTYEGEDNEFIDNTYDNTVYGNTNVLTDSNNNMISGNTNKISYGDNNIIKGNENVIGNEDKANRGGDENYIWGNGNTVESGDKNYILGNTNIVKDFSDSVIWGNGNSLYDGYNGAGTTSSGTLVIGSNNTTSLHFDNGIIFGNNNNVTGGNSGVLAFGHSMQLGAGKDSVVIGNEAKSTGTGSVVIGHGAEGIATGNVVIGENASSTGSGTANNIVIGQKASGKGSEAVAVGYGAENQSSYGAAIGAFSKVGKKTYGLAIGGYAEVADNAMKSIAIGTSGRGDDESNTRVKTGASYSIAMGAKVSVGENAKESMAMGGFAASIGDNATQSIALGTWAHIGEKVTQGSAAGYNAGVSADYGTASGAFSNVTGIGGSAFGYYARALAGYATASGYYAAANATDSTALGYKSSVAEGADNSVAVGANSTVIVRNILDDDEVEAFLTGLGANAYRRDFNITSGDTNGVFSVGSAGGERRIINVARGRISADSTDAVNGSQLYGAVKYLEGKIDAAGGGSGDVSIDGDDNITVTDTAPAAPGTGEGGGTTGGEGGSTGGSTTVPGSGSTGGTGSEGQNFTVNMSDNPVFGGHEEDEQGHLPDGSVTVTDSKGHTVSINEDHNGGITAAGPSYTVTINTNDDGHVAGLENTTWDWDKYREGGYKDSDIAATEAQLHGAIAGIETDITNMGDQITNIGNHVNELDGRIDEVGAGAAALAALHPLDFDPDEKWDFAAGYGHYRSENAVAIGAFYRPNEDTMFSVGGTVGNGDEMINASVSFKIGQGNHVSTSRVAMAKEIIELRKDLEDLRSVMAAGAAGQPLDLSKIQLFPDTPENHWAYDYVATLAGNGLLEGYPDGTFKGDRPVTRYEMAAALYRAMMNGARLSDRALREFAPELDRIRVDTITKDKNGMPEIQRVRVISDRE